jgi:hypothetical protein
MHGKWGQGGIRMRWECMHGMRMGGVCKQCECVLGMGDAGGVCMRWECMHGTGMGWCVHGMGIYAWYGNGVVCAWDGNVCMV